MNSADRLCPHRDGLNRFGALALLVSGVQLRKRSTFAIFLTCLGPSQSSDRRLPRPRMPTYMQRTTALRPYLQKSFTRDYACKMLEPRNHLTRKGAYFMSQRQNYGGQSGKTMGRTPKVTLVGLRGFEPPTPCSRSRCATRLRYSPTVTGGI